MPIEHSVLCPLLIGRAVDLKILDRAFDSVRSGKGQTTLIAGEAGIGKTRLVAEAKARATPLRFLVLQGNCFEPDHALPYAPVLDLLRAYAAAHSADELARALGSNGADLARLVPELLQRIPSSVPASPSEPEAEKRRLFEALGQFITRYAVSTGTALLLVVEDLHWSDDTSLEFLLFLARRIAAQPVLLLLTYRSDQVRPELDHFLGSLDRERCASEVSLSPLNLEQVDAMLRAIFQLDRPVRAEFLSALYSLTEGNPFFIEEVLKSLAASRNLFSADGAWERGPIDELHIPRTVRDAVRQRTTQLSDSAREILSLAAVAGRRFDFPLLQTLAQRTEPALLQDLKELIQAQLVVEESGDRFAFRHALTRQALYSEFLVRERVAMHRRVAQAIERLYSHSPGARSTDLGYHFYEGGEWVKALEYSRRAGAEAQALYAPRAVIEHYTRALGASQQLALPPSADLFRARGKAHETLGDFESALDDYSQALTAARAGRDGAAEWQSLIDLGYLWAGRDYERTGEFFQQALDLADTLAEPKLRARSLNRVGNWYLNKEQPMPARQYHQQALAIFQELNETRGLAETFDLLGMASNLSGDLVQGAANYEQAVALFRELNDRQGLASTIAGVALGSGATYQTETMVGALPTLAASVECCEQALKIAREIGWRSGEAYALWVAGFSLGPQGDYARALESTQSGLEIAEEIGHRQWMSAAHSALGAIYCDMLLLSPARQHLEQALALAKETGSLHWLRVSSGFLACACILQRDTPRAELVLGPALDPSAPAQTLGQRLMSCARAELALARGESEKALNILDQLAASAPNSSPEHPILRLSKLRGEALIALRRTAEAEAAWRAALQLAFDQGARPMLWRIHASLSKLYASQSQHDAAELEIDAARKVIDEISVSVPVMWRQAYVQAARDSLPATRPSSPRRLAKREFGGLTEREREVASLIAQGKSNREIAATLVVGERTIETHVGNVLSKLGFTSRAQIAAWSVEKGLGKPAQ